MASVVKVSFFGKEPFSWGPWAIGGTKLYLIELFLTKSTPLCCSYEPGSGSLVLIGFQFLFLFLASSLNGLNLTAGTLGLRLLCLRNSRGKLDMTNNQCILLDLHFLCSSMDLATSFHYSSSHQGNQRLPPYPRVQTECSINSWACSCGLRGFT